MAEPTAGHAIPAAGPAATRPDGWPVEPKGQAAATAPDEAAVLAELFGPPDTDGIFRGTDDGDQADTGEEPHEPATEPGLEG